MALTDIAIRKAKPGEKPLKLRDGDGLYLLLRPDGARWWFWLKDEEDPDPAKAEQYAHWRTLRQDRLADG